MSVDVKQVAQLFNDLLLNSQISISEATDLTDEMKQVFVHVCVHVGHREGKNGATNRVASTPNMEWENKHITRDDLYINAYI